MDSALEGRWFSDRQGTRKKYSWSRLRLKTPYLVIEENLILVSKKRE
jgi:hypothetical protein